MPVPVLLPIPIPYPVSPPLSSSPTSSPTSSLPPFDSIPFPPPPQKSSPFLFPSVPSVLAKLSPFATSLPTPFALPRPPSPLPPPLHSSSSSSPHPHSSSHLSHPPHSPPHLYPSLYADSDSDSDSTYSPSSRFSSFSSAPHLSPPPSHGAPHHHHPHHPHPATPSPPPHLTTLPCEILYHVTSYLPIPTLLTLSTLTARSLTSDLSLPDFWKFTFISRWGVHYQVDHNTRVSDGIVWGVMKQSSAFVWNAIEFSYSEGLRGGVEGGPMTALVPNTNAPGLEGVGGGGGGGGAGTGGGGGGGGGVRRRRRGGGRRTNKCSELTPPLVRSLICPREGDPSAHRQRSKQWMGVRQWKVACIVRSTKGVDEVELRRCHICNELDVYTSVQREQEMSDGCSSHGNASWLSPCSCGTFTHRQCLESIILSTGLSETDTLRCDVCASPYHVSQRLPLSIPELLWATWRDRGWLCEKLITVALPVYLLSLVAIFALENTQLLLGLDVHPAPFLDRRPTHTGAVRSPLPIHYLFLVWHHLLICILFSSRFHSTVSRIYYTPLYIFYLKLYLLMLSSFIAFFFSFIACPLPLPLHSFITSSLSPSLLATTAAALNGAFYLIASSILIFLFWKTEYRVQTLRGEGGRGGVGEGRVGDDEAEGGEWVDEVQDHEHDNRECLTCGLVHFRSH